MNGAKGENVIIINKMKIDQQILIRANGEELSFHDLYERLVAQDISWLFQEKVIQSSEYAMFNSSSINTVRLNTLIKDNNEIIILSGVFRMGRFHGEVDNVSGGGVAALINTDDGKHYHAMTRYSQKKIKKHPDSGVIIDGFELPMWEQIREYALKAHKLLPFARYLAWDIAVTDNGPVFLEVNSFSGSFCEKYDEMNYMDLEIGKIYKNTFESNG